MNRLSGSRRAVFLNAIAMAIFALTGVTVSAQGTGATVHGHITNPAGGAVKTGDVKLTTDKNLPAKDRVYKFSFPVDQNGDYKGANVQPGDYLAVIMGEGKVLDYQLVTLRAGEDKPMDFDMSRAEYLKSMTPEDRAALEEYKKKNAAVSSDNAKIANINKTLLQAREDEKNGKAADAVKALQGLTEAKPDEAILWASLGEAQLKNGDDLTKAARAAKTSTTDPAIIENYTSAAVSYQKAIDLNGTSKKSTPENLAAYYLNLGQADGKSGKLPEAGTAYDMAAKTSPTMAASAYYNEAVVFYTASKNPEAAAAADKAIAADPKRADAYYIKGQALIPSATVDPKTQKIVTPPGCVEAYQEYLDLAPDGPHAGEVKEILAGLGQPIKNSFKAGKK